MQVTMQGEDHVTVLTEPRTFHHKFSHGVALCAAVTADSRLAMPLLLPALIRLCLLFDHAEEVITIFRVSCTNDQPGTLGIVLMSHCRQFVAHHVAKFVRW